jgi:Flp pilus assembly protein TadD
MTAHDLYTSALQLYNEGEYALTVDQARQLLQEAPKDGRFWHLCGMACWQLKDFVGALEALEEASLWTPLHPQAQYALAACYVWAGLPDLAGTLYEHLGGILEDTRALAAIATHLGAMERYEAALHVCRRITVLNPGHHAAFFGIAYYLSRLGCSPLALVGPLAMALDLAPRVLHYRVNLALAWSDAGLREQAYDLLKSVSLEAISCPCCLRRMRDIFDSVGDAGRSLLCRVRLSCLLQ